MKKKKNRKQLKREKKNLRRQKEMMRIQKSIENSEKSTTAPYTPYTVDAFGQFFRNVNRRGEKVLDDTSQTKMFGCEVVKEVPNHIRRFADTMGLGEFIRVPIRKNKGLTGSGVSFSCHDNSLLLAMRFGGHRLGGYSISKDIDGSDHFIHHSVWVNSKGNASCVSNNYDTSMGTGWDDTDHILFIPVHLGHGNDVGNVYHNAIIEHDWEETDSFILVPESQSDRQFWVYDVSNFLTWGVKETLYTIQSLCHSIHLERCLSKYGWNTTEWTKHNRKNLFERGGFTQKSLATGKSWSEFKSELVTA